MRVLFLTSTLPRFAGDLQANFVGEQAAAWKSARPQDQIFILAPHDDAALLKEECDGAQVIRFRYMPRPKWQALAYPAILPNLKRRPWIAVQILPFLFSQFLAARRLIAEQQIDLIYAHWAMPQALVAMWLKRATGTPYVIQNHSSDLRIFEKLGWGGKAIARQIIRKANHLFCVNEMQREYALELFGSGETEKIKTKVNVLPMGVAPPRPPESGSTWYDFGSISRLSKKKGLHHFIDAAERLASRGVTPRIAIAGDGEDAEELKAMVGVSRTEFPGFLTGAEKEQFFDRTRVFVMPSKASGGDVEGLPVSLLEALCRGKLTIASRDTNIASLPEWPAIEDDILYLEDPADIDKFATMMARAVASPSDPVAASRLRNTMSRYWWPKLITEYLAALGLEAEQTA